MFAVLILDEAGIFRVLRHGDGLELKLTARGFMSALGQLSIRNPALAAAMRNALPSLEVVAEQGEKERALGGPLCEPLPHN